MNKKQLKKCFAAWCVAYTGIIALACVFGVIKAAYELFIGGYENVYAGDWLLVEIPYIFVWYWWYSRLIGHKENDKIDTTLNN